MTTDTHPLVSDYLHRLERAAATLPRGQRSELIGQIREHLDAGLHPGSAEADVRNLLEDLGTPGEIVAAAGPRTVRARRGVREVLTLLLLLTGLPPLVGWVVGVGLLLSSPRWTPGQKLLGVLVWPGGLTAAVTAVFLDLGRGIGAGPWPWAVAEVMFVILPPVGVAAYLYRAAGRPTGSQPSGWSPTD
jgi:hypothetical protein